MEPSPNNTRYMLELEREELIKKRVDFDEKYGTFAFFLLEAFQAVAILAYLFIALFLTFTKKIRSKTNMVVTIWALINMVVLGDKTSKFLTAFMSADDEIIINGTSVCQMLAGLGRFYGASLIVVWLYLKYFKEPKPRYNLFLYFLILLPAFVCAFYLFYHYNVYNYTFEVFGPACDVLSGSTYLLVGFLYVLCKIFVGTERDVSPYPLFLALANLIMNLPISLITIFLRFNLDVNWSYKFHIYFVDLIINLFTASNGFVGVFLVLLYHKCLSKVFAGKVRYFEEEEEKNEWF